MKEISVIIIHHDDEATLPRALVSLALQDVPHRILLVDDGSSNEVGEIAKRFSDLDIDIISTPRAVGRGASRQLAIERVQTEWLTFLDADDWYLPQKLSRQREVARMHRRYQLFSTDLFIAARRGDAPEVRSFDKARGRLEREQVPFAPSLVRTSLAKEVGFDTDYRIGEDRAFLDGVLERCEAVVLDEPLYVYEVSVSRSLPQEWQLRRNHIRQASTDRRSYLSMFGQLARELGAGTYNQLTRISGPLLKSRAARGNPASPEQLQTYDSVYSAITSQLKERGFM